MAQKPPYDSRFPIVRRLEAVGFRAWPAASSTYDGSWQIRLTAGHPSKRLNCVVPLDPGDDRDLDIRLEKVRKRFEDYGRPLIIRETPLAPPALIDGLQGRGWTRFETVRTMTLDLAGLELPDTMDHLPSHDVGRFVDAILKVEDESEATKPALAEILSSIRPQSGYFVIEDPKTGPMATVLCVQDNDLAGLMSLSVEPASRKQGWGVEIVSAALRWARMRGSRSAWLQVAADNAPALRLYEKFGFTDAYSYHYWRMDEAQ